MGALQQAFLPPSGNGSTPLTNNQLLKLIAEFDNREAWNTGGIKNCDASLITVLEESHGNVLNIGRRSRVIPAHIQRALAIRDTSCLRVSLVLRKRGLRLCLLSRLLSLSGRVRKGHKS